MSPTATQQRLETLEQIAIGSVRAAQDNVRSNLSDLTQLADSIRSEGILEPLIVREVEGGFEVVAGHRRLAAAKIAGIPTVPCVVRTFDDDSARIIAMVVENLQRVDLAPLDEAAGYQRLLDLGLTQETVARRVGHPQSHVSQRVALLSLPEIARTKIHHGVISLTTARELTKLRNPELAEQLVADTYPDGNQELDEGEQDWRDQDLRDAAEQAVREQEWAAARTATLAKLEADGIAIASEKQATAYLDDEEIDAHRAETCFGARVSRSGEILYVCLDPDRHQTADEEEPNDDPERAAAARARTETENHRRALRAAGTGRLRHATGLLKRPPKDGLTFIACSILHGVGLYHLKRIADVTGIAPTNDTKEGHLETLLAAARTNALQVLLGIGLAFCEYEIVEQGDSEKFGWSPDPVGSYFAFLEQHGYEAADVEKAMLAAGREDR